MNQVAKENLQNRQCSQIETNMKNKSKKAKDRSEGKDEIKLSNQDDLSETLSKALHINSIGNNLTNGTSEHSHGGSPDMSHGMGVQVGADIEHSTCVNSVQCSVATSSDESKETATQQAINCIINDALEDLENALNNEQSTEPSPKDEIAIISYQSELQMPEIMRLIQKDLSEPYSIYTYRYFIHNWPKLCFLATHEGKCIGAIVCKLDMHRNVVKRGYIAMLAVDEKYRSRKIGSRLAQKAIKVFIQNNNYVKPVLVLQWVHNISIHQPFYFLIPH